MADIGVRIGELSRRVGVSVDVLRAWERRYGVLDPQRSRSGQRLYTAADEDRVLRMRSHIDAGFPPQVAARLVLTEPRHEEPAAAPPVAALELSDALERFDDVAAHAHLDRLLATYTLETVLRDAILPLMRGIGERWERGEVSVAQEHFATNLVSGRLRALTRAWGRGAGPRALVACVPGEQHDVGALCFALALRDRGWRITWLGADVPVLAVADTAAHVDADLVALAAVRRDPLLALAARPIAELAADRRVALGGAGVDAAIAERLGAELLPGGPLEAAASLAP